MTAEIRDAIEQLGWSIYERECFVEICQHSPAGEDFFFTVVSKNIVQEVRKYADNFDPDEHAGMWIANIGRVPGVPESIRTLIDDAEAIKEMLEDLALAIENAEREKKRGKKV